MSTAAEKTGMEKSGFKKLLPTVLSYVLKSGVIFALIYFSLIETTGLTMLFLGLVLSMGLFGLAIWVLALLVIAVLLSKIPPSPEGGGVFKRHFMRPMIIAAGTGVMFLIYFAALALTDIGETARIKHDVAEADAVFQYRTSIYHGSPMKGVDTLHSLITVNYGKKQVTFLIDDYEDYKTVKLGKGAHTCGGNVQKELELPSPGARLITYYPDSGDPERPDMYNYRTCAIELVMDDGTVYSASDLKDKGTKYPEFYGISPYEETVFVPDKDIRKHHGRTSDPFGFYDQ